jgi:rubrerythrin
MKEAVLQTTTELDLENASIGDFIRMGVAAEESAITLYNRIADQLNALGYGKPGNVFRDIAQEEKVHIGEFQALLNQYEEDNEQAEKEGEEEVKELLQENLVEFFEGVVMKENKLARDLPELENILRKNNISFDRVEYDESGYTVISTEFDLPDWEPFEEEERKFISLFPFGDFHGHNIFLAGVDF